ncbi:Exocyst complex component SEC8 [Raphanus sativus]|nr:Exocyst complex component SEC8 [Raphanus sativus]
MGLFDGLPVPSDKNYLRDELARIDESWAVARFDSLPHVVHILTSKDRETDVLLLKEQSDVVEEVVDEVVHAYHGGFNKAIQNYSQILRLFSESTEKLGDLKHDLADAKRSLGTRNKQLHQLWYRSVTLRHIIALLDQIEGISKVPSRIEKLIADKQFYAAIQVYLQSSLMLEREGLQTAVLEKLSYRLIGRHDIEKLMRLDPASACLPALLGHSVSQSEAVGSDVELCELFSSLPSIKQDNLIRDDNKLILLASLSDSLEYVADSIERLGQAVPRAASESEDNSRNQATSPRNLASFADEYRKLATDCLKVLRVEMQLETVFHLQITRRDEGMAPFISGEKRNYVFGGICGIAANASIKALADMRSINLFGVQQICRNTIALEQAMTAIPYIDGESVQQNLDRVRTYFELLNMPFEALLAFIAEHDQMFTPTEYSNLLKVNVPGRDTPTDAQSRLSEILSH